MTPNTFFTHKKAKILAELAQSEYTDKSPKGSVDVEILDLIDEINAFDGYVTTSSCSGRVAVFVEGHKASLSSKVQDGNDLDDDLNTGKGSGSGPGGKGFGNQWLYVSHSPVPSSELEKHDLHALYNLARASIEQDTQTTEGRNAREIRLIKLSFSPLILHVLCASLQAAKPLLAAAINAGFRESGVQSLKALDDEEAGVMLAIRTAGLSFDSVVGQVDTVIREEGAGVVSESYTSLVSEEYLELCTTVVNERFGWNFERRERLRAEIGKIKLKQEQELGSAWEDPVARRKRKKEEGRLRADKTKDTPGKLEEVDVLEDGLSLDIT